MRVAERSVYRRRKGSWRALSLVVFGCAFAPMAGAQAAAATVRGVVRDASGRALAGARVVVLGSAPSVEAESGEDGAFSLAGVPIGPASIVARRIGFAPETLAVASATGRGTVLQLRMQRLAVPLDAVIVNGRNDLRGPLSGFYARRERGNGRFFTQEQIAQRNVSRMSDLLRTIPSMRIAQRRPGQQQFRLRGSTVAPLVWLDGAPMGAGEVDLDSFDPRSFAAIEVYSGPATVPIEFAGARTMSTIGGTIVLWSLRGEAGPRRQRRGAPTPAQLVAGMIETGEAFAASNVDRPAQRDGVDPIVPVYPDSLLAARLPGAVEVEFVVDATGQVRMDTFGVIWTTHPLLGQAVRRALPEVRFVPARRAGRDVAQVVQLPFEFLPDSGAVARKPKD